jgi:hypothetical protein
MALCAGPVIEICGGVVSGGGGVPLTGVFMSVWISAALSARL